LILHLNLKINLFMKKISLALITLLSLASCQQAVLDERPNVVFMVCDDLNDYIGAFGGHVQAITPTWIAWRILG
jgi:iduronate 2-sulfatase